MSEGLRSSDRMFMDYQVRWIKDPARLKLIEKSRQTGISWSEAYSKVRRISRKGNRLDAWVSSRDEIQAKLFLQDCKQWAQVLQLGAEDLGEKIIDREKDLRSMALRFANDQTINSMSSNPDAQAGKRGDRTFDEFALHKDQRQLWAIGQPGLMWGGTMSIISTHRGSQSFFNELITEAREKGNPKKISLHRVTIEDAVREGLLDKIKAKVPGDDPRKIMTPDEFLQSLRDECADEESWQQEYMCVPADDNAAFLEYALLTAAEYPGGEDWEVPLDLCRDLYVGVDIGRKKDFTVIWVAEKFGDMFFTRKIVRLRNKTFSEQEQVLWEILRLPNVRRCCIDSTGLGMQMAERAVEQFPSKVEGVNFTAPIKEALAFPLRGAYEDRRWRIPSGDRTLIADLRCLRKETTAAGNIRFIAESTDEGHADHFWAQALCQHAAETVQEAGKFKAVKAWAAKQLGRTRARKRRTAA